MKYLFTIFLLLSLSMIACSHKQVREKNEENNPDVDPDAPKVSFPVTTKVRVEPRIDGDKYYSGHYMYIIERGSVWTKP